MRSLLLSGDTAWAPLAEVLLHFAARADHVAAAIRPALEAGITVVCDRFTDSTVAYQGYAQGADLGTIAALHAMVGLTPDLTLILDVSEGVAAARLGARPGGRDRYERMPPDFHARVRAGFRAIAEATPGRCRLIDADAEVAAVHSAILRASAMV